MTFGIFDRQIEGMAVKRKPYQFYQHRPIPNPYEVDVVEVLIHPMLDKLKSLDSRDRASAVLDAVPITPVTVDVQGISFPTPFVAVCKIRVSAPAEAVEYQVLKSGADLPTSQAFVDGVITLIYELSDHGLEFLDQFDEDLHVWKEWAKALNEATKSYRDDASVKVGAAIERAITLQSGVETLTSRFNEKYGLVRRPSNT